MLVQPIPNSHALPLTLPRLPDFIIALVHHLIYFILNLLLHDPPNGDHLLLALRYLVQRLRGDDLVEFLLVALDS